MNYSDDECTVETFFSESGDCRARVVRDDDPIEPDCDAGCPVIRIESDWYFGVEATSYGRYSAYRSGVKAEYALEYYLSIMGVEEAVEVFDRYLRVFHNGRAAIIMTPGYRSDYYYVAYTTERMAREAWGVEDVTEDVLTPEADEWVSYVEGEVYGIVTERRVYEIDEFETLAGTAFLETPTEDWVEVGSVWGYYGDPYAETGEYIIEDAKGMVRDNLMEHAAKGVQAYEVLRNAQ